LSGNILLIGQSHVAAVRAAAKIRREHDPAAPRTRVIHTLEPQYAPELEEGGSRFATPLATAIGDQIDRHAPRVASCIGGNYHNVLSLIRHPRPFDFRLAEEDSVDPAAETLPLALVRETLAKGMATDLTRMRLLADLAGPFLHLQSPPPLADDELIAERADAFFRESAIAELGVAPAALRRRMWLLSSSIVREKCDAIGARFVPVPREVMTTDGFLDKDFAGDATHGNARYGEVLIRTLEAEPWPI
jgi:hypothetical protein